MESADKLLRQANVLRGPYQVAIDITNKCNYRCTHCYNASGENNIVNNELTDIELKDLILDVAQMLPDNVCFCGGEPLLRLEVLLECSRILHENGVKNISIVSNGYFINRDTAIMLKDNYVNRVQISLDGANAESCYFIRNNMKAFDKAVNALKILKQIHMGEVFIAFCPTSRNIAELPEVAKICENIGIYTIRLQPLMTIGRGLDNAKYIQPSNSQYIELLKIIKQMKENGSKIDFDWADPVDHLIRYRGKLKNLCTFVSVKANGSITLSPYLPISLGNIRKHRLSEYWNKGLASVWNKELCQKMASTINSIYDMGKSSITVWKENDIEYDILETGE